MSTEAAVGLEALQAAREIDAKARTRSSLMGSAVGRTESSGGLVHSLMVWN
jgi:hypothetical protein